MTFTPHWTRHCLIAGLCAATLVSEAAEPAGILVDDGDASYVGGWVSSTKKDALVGAGYRHDNNQEQGTKTATFTATIAEAGEYEVRLIYIATSNRATQVPVTVTSADGGKTLTLNQREEAVIGGVPRALGVFRFDANSKATVVVSNKDTNGYVIVDAVQWVPAAIAKAEREGSRPAGFGSKPAGTPGRGVNRSPMAAAVALSPLAAQTAPGHQPPKADNQPICLAEAAKAAAVNGQHYDFVVVGGTGSGVLCAVRAAREGCKVLLVQHNRHIGGMMANGLMQWDALYGGPRAPLFTELLGNIEKHYVDTYGKDSPHHQTMRYTHEHYPVGWAEPHVAEREFHRLIAGEANITLLYSHYPVEAKLDGALIKAVTLREYGTENDIQVTGTTFADATYEGDLFALARIPYRSGREARDEYDEPHAGKVFCNVGGEPAPKDAIEGRLNIRPYGQSQGSIDPTSPFTADNAIQAYNYRFCVSKDPNNRVLPEKPANYNREEYVNYGRKSIATNPGPNLKSHMNSPILPGENHAYPEASWPEREKIIARHRDFALGLMWFLQNDESLSEKQREGFRQWGLAKDEFLDHGHIPYEMYVREARRTVGRHVFTEHDNSLSKDYARTPIFEDSIAITDWYMDSHSCTTETRPGYHYDGKLILTEESRPAQIPYRSLLSKEIENILVPVCLSSTHIAWGAIRLEPVWMQTGEAAGFAAALAKKDGVTVGALNADKLVRTLAEKRQLISFFNDVKVTGEAAWIPAVQYFGTKGFFASYDARAEAPLDSETAGAWHVALDYLAVRKLKPGAIATRLQKLKSSDRTVTGEQFQAMLRQSKSLQRDQIEAAFNTLKIDAARPLSRGHACLIMYNIISGK